MAERINYKIKRGDTTPLDKFSIEDLEGKKIVLSDNDNIYFTMKTFEDEAVLKKSINEGITLGEDGFYHIMIEDVDTEELEATIYKYDIELDLELTDRHYVKTLIEGKINLKADVTLKEDR